MECGKLAKGRSFLLDQPPVIDIMTEQQCRSYRAQMEQFQRKMNDAYDDLWEAHLSPFMKPPRPDGDGQEE